MKILAKISVLKNSSTQLQYFTPYSYSNTHRFAAARLTHTRVPRQSMVAAHLHDQCRHVQSVRAGVLPEQLVAQFRAHL